MDYKKVTFAEYQEKKRKVMDSLGRKYGTCGGVNCSECPFLDEKVDDCTIYLEYENPLKAIKVIVDYEILINWNEVKKKG